MQLRGHNLLPFHYDKQLLFMESVYDVFVANQFPIARVNISDWKLSESAVNGSRCGAWQLAESCGVSGLDLSSCLDAQSQNGAMSQARGAKCPVCPSIRRLPLQFC